MNAAATHGDLYPAQYNHPLVGRPMQTKNQQRGGIVSRVVPSQFGPLAILGKDHTTAYAIADLQPMPEQPIGDNVAICGFNGTITNSRGESLIVWTCINGSFYAESDTAEDGDENGRYLSVAQFTAWQKA